MAHLLTRLSQFGQCHSRGGGGAVRPGPAANHPPVICQKLGGGEGPGRTPKYGYQNDQRNARLF